MPRHSHAGAVVVTMSGPGLPLLPTPIALHFQRERLYFHCRAMKCLCMTAPHCAINLMLAELTGQKPMQPLLGTEHYQCMDSLFIWGSIRHCSLCFSTLNMRQAARPCWPQSNVDEESFSTGHTAAAIPEYSDLVLDLNWNFCAFLFTTQIVNQSSLQQRDVKRKEKWPWLWFLLN